MASEGDGDNGDKQQGAGDLSDVVCFVAWNDTDPRTAELFTYCLDCAETADNWPDVAGWPLYRLQPLDKVDYDAITQDGARTLCHRCTADVLTVYGRRQEARNR
jgi:hypothetical protein